MELIHKNYFGLNGFLICLHHCIQNTPNQPSQVTLLWDRIQKESLPRIACALGAYKVLPKFALVGAGCQLSLCLYKFSKGVMIPALRRTDEPIEEPLRECSEHLIRASYNLTLFFFRKLSALAFLFPYEVLAMHEKFEGVLIPKTPPVDETRDPLIKKCARFVAGLLLNRLSPEDDVRIPLREQATGLFRTASTFAATLLAGRRSYGHL